MSEEQSDKGPLSGIVVLDFTWVVAGPQATRQWADWGADVYRIEWPENPDLVRSVGRAPTNSPDALYDSGGTMYYSLNASKKGVTLNMKTEKGRAIFWEMVRKADIVAQNFAPQAMEKWGIDYETLRAVNPRIIYVTISGYGHSGPNKYYLTYGPSAQAMSGLTQSSGLPGHEPAGWGFSYMDHTGGYVGSIGLLAALYEREFSGVGQHVDLSQAEAAMNLTGAAFLDYSVNGRSSRRPGFPPGNRASWPGHPVTSAYRVDPTVAPHNSYRTRPSRRTEADPDNNWVVITCFTHEQWCSLAAAMGAPELVSDPRFATLQQRLKNQEELDALIEAWTMGFDKFDVMYRLQPLGIPAGAVQSSKDRVVSDPQLRHRGMHSLQKGHPIWGDRLAEEVPVRMSVSQPHIRRRGPLIGEDNVESYRALLGYSEDEVRALVEDGTLWPRGAARPSWVHGVDQDAELKMAGE